MVLIKQDGITGVCEFAGLSTETFPKKADLPLEISGQTVRFMNSESIFMCTDTFTPWMYNVEEDKWSDGTTKR